MKKSQRLLGSVILAVFLLSIASCTTRPVLKKDFLQMFHPQTEPTQNVETTSPTVTEPSETVPQTEPTVDLPTEPTVQITEPSGEGSIGPYSREELQGMDRSNITYGPGASVDEHGRPHGAMQYNAQYADYDAWFVGPDDGNIYLTFDLGWENEGMTNDFLDILQEKDVKAVFFVLKEYCERNPEIIRRIIDEGHILASHAYSHKTLADLTIDQIVEQIWKLHVYVREEFGYEMTLFRPPSGEFSQQVLAIAHGMGYRTVNWSYAYVDWLADDQPDVQKSYQRLMDHAHSGCIYLLHTVSTTNLALLGDLIDGLRAEGYEFQLFTDQVS